MKNFKRILSLSICCVMIASLFAVLPVRTAAADEELVTGQFVAGTYSYGESWSIAEGAYVPFTIGTSLYLPKDYSPEKEYGLLVYFHNAGGRGEGASYSSGKGNTLTTNVINKSGDEYIIFAPRCPKEPEQWVSSTWVPGVYNYDSTKVSPAMDAVINYIYEEILAKYSVDTSRIVVAGDSMGGGGTWDIILREPDLFAAALPVAGYPDPLQAANIREDLAIWAVHTMQDKTVNVRGDRAMTATLKNLGRTNIKYTEYDTSDAATKAKFNGSWNSSTNWEHWAWVPAYADADMVNWLISQRKAEGTTAKVESKFEDIEDSATYCKAVNYVTEAGLFYGMSETEFAPTKSMTRAQFVTVLGRYAGVDVTEYTDVTFTDVDPVYGSWYAPYVDWATKNGIIQGMGDGTFGVNKNITIEQACAILARFLEYKEAPNNTQLTLDAYSDVTVISDWATESLEWAIENSVYMGTLGSTRMLRSRNPAARSLIATMFYNVTTIYGK